VSSRPPYARQLHSGLPRSQFTATASTARANTILSSTNRKSIFTGRRCPRNHCGVTKRDVNTDLFAHEGCCAATRCYSPLRSREVGMGMYAISSLSRGRACGVSTVKVLKLPQSGIGTQAACARGIGRLTIERWCRCSYRTACAIGSRWRDQLSHVVWGSKTSRLRKDGVIQPARPQHRPKTPLQAGL
jgi:hypothetical protein